MDLAVYARNYRDLANFVMFCLVMSSTSARSCDGPPKPAESLDSSLHPQNWDPPPVIMPKPVEFKLSTTLGFS